MHNQAHMIHCYVFVISIDCGPIFLAVIKVFHVVFSDFYGE